MIRKTNIVDIVVDGDGTPASGQVVVHWPMFMVNGTAVTQGQRAYEIIDGQLNLDLFPTISAQPSGSYYTATFELDNGSVYDEYWVIPALDTVKLNQIRAMFPPAPGLFINSLQITGGGAQIGQFLGWNGTQWVPMNPSLINFTPNTIGLTVSANPASDISVPVDSAVLGAGLALNIPDAGPTSRGVATAGAQTFGGTKTFQDRTTFSSTLLLSSFVPANPAWGTISFDGAQNIFHLQGSLQLHGLGENLGMLLIDQAALKRLDLTGAALSETVSNPGVTFPGKESILLPGATVAHGIGVDVNDWLWLGSGNAFASLRPDAAWVSNWIDLSPYQHPISPGIEAVPSQASVVLYRDAQNWIGMGVDTDMRIWFRIGANNAGKYYYLAPDGGSLGVYTWANSVLVAQRAGINLIAGQYATITATDNPTQNTVDVVIAAAGNLVDPTIQRGDLITRDAMGITRLPAIYDNEYRVLTCDPWHHPGLSWTIGVPTSRRIIAGAGLWGGGDLSGDVDIWANVLSVFGRTGNITMSAADIINAGGMVDPTVLRGDLIVRGANLTVNQGTTRLGPGIDGSVLVCDSAQPLGVYWVPGGEFGAQTPWLQNVDGAGYRLFNVSLMTAIGAITAVGQIGIGTTTPAHALDVVGDGAFTGNLSVGGNFDVTGTSTLTGDVQMDADLNVAGDSTMLNLTVTGSLTTGASVVIGDFDVTGDTTLGGTLDVAGNAALAADLTVAGDSSLTGILDVTGDSTFGNITVTGTSNLQGALTVSADSAFTGDVAVTGDTALTGAFGVTGDSVFTGDVSISGDLEVATILSPSIGSGSTSPVTFQPPLEAGSIELNPDIQFWGNVQAAIAAIDQHIITLSRGMAYVGEYDAANDIATFVPALSALNGLLPPANSPGLNPGDFLVATSDGPTMHIGDQLVSDGTNWNVLAVGNVAMTASMVAVGSGTGIPAGWTTVQAALQDLATGGMQTPWLSNINADGWALCSGSISNALVFATGTTLSPTERMRITSAGWVGIGTAAPAVLLDVNGDARFGNITVNNTVTALGNLVLAAGSQTYALYIQASNGNVGVGGTATPAAKFTVTGLGSAGAPVNSNAAAALLVSSASGLANQGGEIRIGFSAQTTFFYAIKGLGSDGGANTAGDLAFYSRLSSANASVTEVIRMTSAGNMGIGNSGSPDLLGQTENTTAAVHLMVGSRTAANGPGKVSICGYTGISGNQIGILQFVNFQPTSTPDLRLAAIQCVYGSFTNAGHLIFHTNPGGASTGALLERMRITQAGNVAIANDGTVSPIAPTGFPFLAIGPNTSSSVYGFVTVCGNTATLAAAVGVFAFANYNITATEKRVAEINCITDGAVNSGALRFDTWNAGVRGANSERMRLTAAGALGIGTSTPAAVLHVMNATGHGTIRVQGQNTAGAEAYISFVKTNPTQEYQIGYIDATTNWCIWNGSTLLTVTNAGNLGLGLTPTYRLQLSTDSAAKPGTNTWAIVSDIRTKRNVEPFEGGMETIRQLEPIVAEYNGMASMPDGMRVVSLDPAKLREIVPGAVSSVRGKLREADEEETDILGVNTHEIFYHLLRAVQQIDQRLQRLESQ